MQPNEDDSWMEAWEQIVEEVTKTDIPLECIQKIIFKLYGGRQRTVNIRTLSRQGLDFEDIHGVVSKKFEEFDEHIRDVDFVIDIMSVARLVQPETDRLLGDL